MANGGSKEWLQYVNVVVTAITAILSSVVVLMTRTIHVMINSQLTRMLKSERDAGGLEERDKERARRDKDPPPV